MKGLEVDEFTMISNNCWSLTICENFGIRKDISATGLFIMSCDIVRFYVIWTDIWQLRWSSFRLTSPGGGTPLVRGSIGGPTSFAALPTLNFMCCTTTTKRTPTASERPS